MLPALALAACGGGGGGSSSAPAGITARALSTSTAPTVFPQPVAAPATVTASGWQAVAAAAAQLPAASGTTWLHLWSTDTAGEVVTLALVQWTPSLPAPVVQAPAAGAAIRFEIYNAAGAVTGSL